ncbi:MAG TPA: Uma2 family endonuclease [Chitinophagaceae bacterium]|nr:Uma2 family endonuclease [Chitinophagaceae bacterium]
MENMVKEPAPKYNYVSPDEYLLMERASEEKHEYFDGYVVAMSGARLKHNQVAANLMIDIGSFLKDKNCQVLPSDMRVTTPARDAYMYPDVTIVCNEPKLEDEKFDTLINPTVIIEIWSPSTQNQDKGYKLIHYKNIPSLKEYIMIDTAKRLIHLMRKEANGAWRFEEINDPTGELYIEAINFKISFIDLYRNTGL